MRLSDLSVGTEFEYINSVRSFRRGRFLVLNSEGNYLRPSSRIGCVFIYSFTAKAVCNHWGGLEVNEISKLEETVKNTMGHFIGWEFGVPVRVGDKQNEFAFREGRLTRETAIGFSVHWVKGGQCNLRKAGFYYELIPHNTEYGSGPIYPICQREDGVGPHLNKSLRTFAGVSDTLRSIPAATLNIDGKTIELSAETTAELKKKLRA